MKNILTNIFPFLSSKSKYNQIYCQQTLNFAQTILNRSSTKSEKINGLTHLIKVLSLSIQTKILEDLLYNELHHSKRSEPINLYLSIGDSGTNDSCFFSVSKNSNKPSKSLASFPAITVPWHKERLATTFHTIGIRNHNPFKEDPLNHLSNTLIFPLNLLIIPNGTHSSVTGLFEDNANVTVDQVIDLTHSFQTYVFDGNYFRGQLPNKPDIKPDYTEFGIIYEIGRMIYENHLVEKWEES